MIYLHNCTSQKKTFILQIAADTLTPHMHKQKRHSSKKPTKQETGKLWLLAAFYLAAWKSGKKNRK
jgi:hypothetical protein